MIKEDLKELGARLGTIESIALIPRVGSTFELGTRVLAECIENELEVPSSMILAREQFSGKGRAGRTWHSPAGKGIYATMTFSVPSDVAPLLPLSVAVAVARFLEEVWEIDAGVKWPNDILVGGKKIAGILISARHCEANAYVAVGIGINVRRTDGAPENAITVEDVCEARIDLDDASSKFIDFFDGRFDRVRDPEEILAEWRSLTVHEAGDPIRCRVEDRVVEGKWVGIDDSGRAVLEADGARETIAAGDLIDWK
ncbi:MAG: biotin--[acetyl-CoA-carboxylase] ligase [Thermoanaerobaculia bacterium]|nr:biotin--[acetyl-CoA-carboxylase] ligase [Thermoanaerobaculia bacterium]